MTKAILLKLKGDIFLETEEILKAHKQSRNSYISEALDFFNKVNKRKMLAKKLAKESFLSRKVSLEVLEEFEDMEDEIFE